MKWIILIVIQLKIKEIKDFKRVVIESIDKFISYIKRATKKKGTEKKNIEKKDTEKEHIEKVNAKKKQLRT